MSVRSRRTPRRVTLARGDGPHAQVGRTDVQSGPKTLKITDPKPAG
ncbi:hypothetical protein JK361_05910 [Streptomyces sp. 5-8]|uniref:Uncharacterized protein n=1 Tax=Streptomyces musisoli TaxID=2802280 RepID=A0ABS1NVY3_9ACTN|nr:MULTISPECIES: hypothetical protein [Streptomyces]MBL1104144.1 hypothetical protein [Streptomyces musisoli]MBY8840217.1 hypothetical protein [Streptomyces sp. SP2-10]